MAITRLLAWARLDRPQARRSDPQLVEIVVHDQDSRTSSHGFCSFVCAVRASRAAAATAFTKSSNRYDGEVIRFKLLLRHSLFGDSHVNHR